MNICTIVCRNYIAQARVLAASFAEHYPESTCTVLVLDADDAQDYSDEPFRTITPSDLAISEFAIMAGIYDALELSTAVKPWLMDWMADHHGDGPVAYFDPDIQVMSRMVELEEMLQTHWVVLTPHFTHPLPLDGEAPSEQAILLAGTYNLGFIAVNPGSDFVRFSDWWKERLARLCRVDPPNGFFVDQRFVDFVPGMFDGVGILRHDGYNVAYWNLPTRVITAGDDGPEANGLPVRFFHFSGFNPQRPTVVSKHQTRVHLGAREPVLTSLFEDYAAVLLRQGYAEASSIPYGYRRSAHGHELSRPVRMVYAAAVEKGFSGSLFEQRDDRAFEDLLATPAAPHGLIPTGLQYLWDTTPELRELFPDPQLRDRAEYLHWCDSEHARQRFLAGYLEAPQTRGRLGRRRPSGVNVIGYLNAESGVGEAARSVIGLLDEAGVPVWPVAVDAPGVPNRVPFRAPRGTPDLPFERSLLCVNADMVTSVVPYLARYGLRDTEVTGLWWWETSDFPERFDPAFACVDRVIAGTTFVRDAIARRGRVPVASFPLPVDPGPVSPTVPRGLEWPEGFIFYFSFDYASVVARKNPMGVVEAYRNAFGPADGCRLVLKSINADRYAADHAILAAAVVDRSDIHLVDAFLTQPDRAWMIDNCDCYVSLHRSEGFGLTIAEAMYLGKPVIATGYSGNMDFMTDDNALPVRFEMTSIGSHAGPYEADGEWAEPDLSHAASLMRFIVENPMTGRELGRRAAASIRDTHSRERGAQTLAQIFLGGQDG